MSNVVQVRHLEDWTKKRYTYYVPDDVVLKPGDVVLSKNNDGSNVVSVCVTMSEDLSENAIDMIMQGKKVTSEIIGIYNLELFCDRNKTFDF